MTATHSHRLTEWTAALLMGFSAAWPLSALAQTPAAPAAWSPPALPDGQPDVRGFYGPQKQGTFSLTHPSNGGVGEVLHNRALEKAGKPIPVWPSRIVDPADGEIPYQPWARAKQKYIEANIDHPTKQEHLDPQERCFPDGPVRAPLWTGFEIQQYPGYVVIIQDQNHTFRVIPLDGRPHPSQAVKLWMGNSRGHWEGNTLVVDIQNENSKGRLDNIGDFSSDKVHIVERYTFNDATSFDYRATFDDPSVYTRPWTLYAKYKRQHLDEPDYEPWEQACQEGEKNSSESLLGDGSRAAP
ncbi:MAG TPA: hypothetical protein VG960_08485 [Caulobacteraceae bacterium]|nr:hypothetical protein [Caulobacteraceae bacterium]